MKLFAQDLADIKLDQDASTDLAVAIGVEIGIDWDTVEFDVEQFLAGLKVELEHGTKNPDTNITDDDPTTTGKIAWVHLLESPEYYIKLAAMEQPNK